ncbi:MAG: hypothetical protein ABI412_03140 [Sphingomicrobium sp.]
MSLIALLALLMQPADANAASGFYRSATPEVGAAIELEPDGHFLYALDYGAVSEAAEGTWTLAGSEVRLTATKTEGAWRGASLGDSPLVFEGHDLLLRRYDIVIRFKRDAPLTLPDRRNEKLEKGN